VVESTILNPLPVEVNCLKYVVFWGVFTIELTGILIFVYICLLDEGARNKNIYKIIESIQ